MTLSPFLFLALFSCYHLVFITIWTRVWLAGLIGDSFLKRHGRKLYHHSDTDLLWPKARPICLGLPRLPHSTPAWRRQPPSNTVTGAPKPHRKQTPHRSVLWNTQSVGQVWQQTTSAVRKRKMCWLLTEQLGCHKTNNLNQWFRSCFSSRQRYSSDDGFASHCLHHGIKRK